MDALNQSYGVQAHAYHWDVNTLDWLKNEGTSGAPAADVSVLNFPATQPVSGPLTDAQLAARLPLAVLATIDPTGLATALGQTAGNASLASIDGKLANPLPVSGTFFQGTQPISATSLPLPALAATSTIQATQQTTLDAIKAAVETIDNFISGVRGLVTEDNSAAIKARTDNIPPLGQAVAVNSVPVVLPALQQAALTPPAAITGFALESTQQLQATAANQVTEIASLATIAALSKAEDSAHTSADPGVPIWAVRQDDPTILTSASGDYQAPTTDAFGRLWVNGSNVTQPVIDPVSRALEMRLVLMASAQPTNGFVPQEIPAFFAGF